ncbi:MAG: MBL fold metallo-hydrolase [Myxococcales bacterium]|nr:MBL fold metallo-hydrolase [Myxococcales bacterium]
MSEPLPGLPAGPPPPRPADAAVAVPFRRAGNTVEVFWLKRSSQVSFAPGFHAFPGGRVDAADGAVPVEGVFGMDAALRVCAARELFEEAGVLVAEGSPPSADGLRQARRELLEGKVSFGELLSRWRLSVRAQDFHDAGRWITPSFMPRRFDARLFLVAMPGASQAEAWPGEVAEGGWVRPADALLRWEQGTALLHPPNLFAMQTLAGFTSVADAAARMSLPPHSPNFTATRIEFQRGIRVFPLETVTLPPATHTNAYVLGNGEMLVVDPGSPEVRQYARLLALVSGLRAEGLRPKAVLLTHHHSDHIGGAKAVKERLNVPVWCHRRTAERLPFEVERVLEDGEIIHIAGGRPMRLRVLHTPGHTRGHLCLVDEATRAAIVGDMVAGTGTVMIDPPEGDMTDYLAQLQRLKDLPVGTLYPSHGPVMPDGVAKLAEYLHHREFRERLVLGAIGPAGAAIQEIVPKAYGDTPEGMHPVAERSALAILIKLSREGKVKRKDERYFLS